MPGEPANYRPGFVQSAFGTGNLPHLRNAGMMGTGDTLNRYNDYMQGKFAYDQSGTRMTAPPMANPNQQVENAYRMYLDRSAEPAGMNFWGQHVAQGMTPGRLGEFIRTSPEYASRWSAGMAAGQPMATQRMPGVAPGVAPAPTVPRLQDRNLDQLVYQMSPQGQAEDQQLLDEDKARKDAIITANAKWQTEEAERLRQRGELEKEQSAAAAAEEAERERQRQEAAAAQAQALFLALAMSRMCDARTKTNLTLLGEDPNGIPLYAFDYVDDIERCRRTGELMPPKRIGPLAQDVAEKFPDMVMMVGDTMVLKGAHEP